MLSKLYNNQSTIMTRLNTAKVYLKTAKIATHTRTTKASAPITAPATSPESGGSTAGFVGAK